MTAAGELARRLAEKERAREELHRAEQERIKRQAKAA